jgi:hypothetical protein
VELLIYCTSDVPQHVHAAMHGCLDAEEAVLDFVAAIVQSKQLQVPTPLAANLLFVAEPKGSVRPMGEVWYRSTCLCALAASNVVGPSLAPLQLAVGVSWGAQICGHASQLGAVADLSCVAVQLNWSLPTGPTGRKAGSKCLVGPMLPSRPSTACARATHSVLCSLL